MPVADDAGRRALSPDLGRLLHDLRGPLNSLTMHAEVLKRTVRDDPLAADSLRTVLEQLGRLAEMLPAAFAVASLERRDWGVVDLGAVAAAAQGDAGGPVTWSSTRSSSSGVVSTSRSKATSRRERAMRAHAVCRCAPGIHHAGTIARTLYRRAPGPSRLCDCL